MANVNTLAKRKQIVLAVAVAVGTAALVGGGLWISNLSMKKDAMKHVAPKEPVPDLTGVVDRTFDNKVQQSAIVQSQLSNQQVLKEMDGLRRELKLLDKSRQDDQSRIKALEDDKKLLQTQIDAMNNAPPDFPAGVPDGEPRPSMGSGSSIPPSTAFYPGMGAVPPVQTTYTPIAPPGGMEHTDFSYEKDLKNALPYIFSGSFANALVIEGADANAAVTGSQNTAPMQFRLTGLVNMPNDKTFDLRNCFVTAEAYGDVSSERAEVRTRSISCSLPQGDVDMKIKGHISFMGKNGIKGTVVMRNGKILGLAGFSGFLDGIGRGIEKASTPTVGIGATASMGASDVMGAGIGGGASKAAQTLSEYYIKRAEQYHEIIPIGAGNKVTVVFNDGFQLLTLEEMNKGKAKKASLEPSESIQERGRNAVQDVKNLKLGDMIHPLPGKMAN